MIYLTGDLHGSIDIRKLNFENFSIGQVMTKDDYLIILGDFGLIWHDNKEERYWVDWLTGRPWTTLFIDGNHENFDRLNLLSEIEMFGGKVGKYTNSIYHLKRGEIYTIDGKKFFTFGGANSIDKLVRSEGISWWRDEQPNFYEMKRGINNLQKYYFDIDYILTHTCPDSLVSKLKIFGIEKYGLDDNDNTRKYLDTILEMVNFKKWYFGHWHDNKVIEDKYVLLYENIVKLD
jgi:DNA repair exonuclease SbcCD nuclease subunit